MNRTMMACLCNKRLNMEVEFCRIEGNGDRGVKTRKVLYIETGQMACCGLWVGVEVETFLISGLGSFHPDHAAFKTHLVAIYLLSPLPCA